jgi:hypothetical protein
MNINLIKKRLSTQGSIDKIIRNYINSFYNARPFMPGYKDIGNGIGISNLGNYNTDTKSGSVDASEYEKQFKQLVTNMFISNYADIYPADSKMLEAYFYRVYSRKYYYTFDNSYRYSIDSNPELKAMSDDIDALPKDLLFAKRKMVEKRESFYKSHILSLNIAPHFRAEFVNELFNQVNELNKSRVYANKGLDRSRPLVRITVQIPKAKRLSLNEKDGVTIMCNTRDLEDVFNLINTTFDKLGPKSYISRGEPNSLLGNPFGCVAYDSYDTDFGKTASEIFGEIVIKALDLEIEKNKKKLNIQPGEDITLYRQQCLAELLRRNNLHYYSIVRTVKQLLSARPNKKSFSYDLDPDMLFVSPLVRDAIESVYEKRKYKVVSSTPYITLDEKRVKKF